MAVRLASEAAEFVRHRRGTVDWTASVRTKSSETDPVTLVDTDCERLLRRRLASLRPDDAILGEEDGRVRAARCPAAPDNRPVCVG